MADLDFIKVIGRLGEVVTDGSIDPDEYPDTKWADSGEVWITPLITTTKVAHADPVPATLGQTIIKATVDDQGYVSLRENRRIWVVDLTSNKVNPRVPDGKATHLVQFIGIKSGDDDILFEDFNARFAPDTIDPESGACDLTLVAPLTFTGGIAITKGDKGDKGDTGDTGPLPTLIFHSPVAVNPGEDPTQDIDETDEGVYDITFGIPRGKGVNLITGSADTLSPTSPVSFSLESPIETEDVFTQIMHIGVPKGDTGLTGPSRWLVYTAGAYPARVDSQPHVFIGSANPNTLGLMLDGDVWINNSDPGAVPAATPIFGSGIPEGSVVAPVGQSYVDLTVTRGAYRWEKKTGTGNTGWKVVDGDTGWRSLSASMLATLTPATAGPTPFAIRRVNERVYTRGAASPTGALIGVSRTAVVSGVFDLTSLTGFRNLDGGLGSYDIKGLTTPPVLGWSAGYLTTTGSNQRFDLYFPGATGNWGSSDRLAWETVHTTDDLWPTTLTAAT